MNWYKLAIKKVAMNAQIIAKIDEAIRKNLPNAENLIIELQNNPAGYNEFIKDMGLMDKIGLTNNSSTPSNTGTGNQSLFEQGGWANTIDQFFINVRDRGFENKGTNDFFARLNSLIGKDIGRDFYGRPQSGNA